MSSALARCSQRPILQPDSLQFGHLRFSITEGLQQLCRWALAVVVSLVIAPGWVRAQSKEVASQVHEQVQELIDQLGSDRFQEREAASAELLAIGEPALLALATAEQGSDAEVRKRARAIRERIENDKFDVLAQSFIRDPDPTASYGLPGWTSFSRAAGASRTAKRLFLDMLERRRLIGLCLEAIDGGSVPAGVFEGLPADPQQRLWTVVGMTCREIRQSLYQKGNRPVTGDCIALLVAAAVLDNPPQDLHDTIKSEYQFGGYQTLLLQPSARVSTRRMLGKWMLKAPVTMAEDVISIAHQTQVAEGADMARRLLAAPAEDAAKAQALICLARFGSVEDLDLIDKFVDDATVLEQFEQGDRGDDIRVERIAPPFRQPPNPQDAQAQRRRYERRLGDVALAAGFKLAGFDVEELFPIIVLEDRMAIRETTIGFPVDQPELRNAALKAWRDFRAKKTSPPPAVAQPAS